MQPSFIHLRVHTEFSLVDGLVRIPSLMQALVANEMNAIAITDYCNLFAAVKMFKAAISAGIKPILGSELPCHDLTAPGAVTSLVLLCQNEIGYRNLTCLISKAYQEGQQQGQPRVQQQWLALHAQGLIALSGGRSGAIGKALLANDEPGAYKLAQFFASIFAGSFYLELQRTGRADEIEYNVKVVRLAEALNLPLVATNDVCFLQQEDFEAHEARVCIRDGFTLADFRRKKNYSSQQYLRTAVEMRELFHDVPQALANTIQIAKRCTVMLDLGNNYLPKCHIPESITAENYLSKLSLQGLESRLRQIFPNQAPDSWSQVTAAYTQRLEKELNVINSMGFAGYFLIVADLIQWAKQNGVSVGPGRGSGPGSLVAYALQITDLDPLHYELLFERFLNPDRVSMPDFDIDFCMEGREKVIEYVATKYGRDNVSQIITFGTMAAKAVVRDVGRILGHPYGFVDQIAKLIPFEVGITLSKALAEEDELKRRYQHEEEVKELIELAIKLEGIARNAGKHAGGVVIAPSKLTDFTAIYCEQDSSQLVSQFDKDDVEAVGLVKFDFLGLKTLTIIDWTITTINTQLAPNAPVDVTLLATNDAKTYSLLQACHTTAVFQLESRGIKDLIKRLQPDCFADVIALVALFRPGPLQSGMVDDFINRKHGYAEVTYPHPDLEPILKPTYGVILYQEQVMQIAQVLANYTLGGADLLRRAMGKKKPQEMAKQRAIFMQGAITRGINPDTATHVFDLMEKFAGYGFNKSHSVAYALIAYQTAWLKAHYPAAFMAAVMTADMDNTTKIISFLDECTNMQLVVKPPAINHSNYRFTVTDNKTIFYGLGAIKGAGEAAITCIVEERSRGGVFSDLFSFCQRIDLHKVNRRVLEALIKCGAMDCWGIDRAMLCASLDKALRLADRMQQNRVSGQLDLLSILHDGEAQEEYLACEPWTEALRLEGEKESLGFYLTGHPASQYCAEFKTLVTPIQAINLNAKKNVLVCGLITAIRRITTKYGKKLIIMSVEDPSGKIEIINFGEEAEQLAKFEVGHILITEGEAAVDEYNGGMKMRAHHLYSVEEVRRQFSKCLILELAANGANNVIPALQAILKMHRGECLVQFNYASANAVANLKLGAQWRVLISEQLLTELAKILGKSKVYVIY